VVEYQGGVFIKDRVIRIDPEKKQVFTDSGKVVRYDLLSFNAGSYVPMTPVKEESGNIYPVKPIERLMEAADKLKALFREKKIHVSIVGGGPSSAEVAGNVWQLARRMNATMPEITIFAGNKFMARFDRRVRRRMRKILLDKGIQIDETGYVRQVTSRNIVLESGRTAETDFIFMALGVRPSTIFETSGLPVGPDKGLLVNTCLQSVKYPDIFGGGDCICFENQPLDKVGVYAVRQNPVLLYNLLARVENRKLQTFDPGPEYLLIFNAGGGLGVLKKKGLVFGGKTAFWIKDYIDRKFMKKFQAFEKKI
jgi:NADH dehydrogenase FAD-containing subunit